MHIVVCVKQVLDPEIPPSAFKVGTDGRTPVVEGIPASTVMDSYAENALEAGIRLRDTVDGARLTALCVGSEDQVEVLRRALAFTADAAVRTWDPSWEELDGLGIGHVLAHAVMKLGQTDLVLCGRQASDVEEGLVGPALAEELGWPCVTVGRDLRFADDRLTVEREVDGLVETVAVSPPAVVTLTSSEKNAPRMLKVKDIMLSRGKPVRTVEPEQLDLDPNRLDGSMRLERLELPESRGRSEMLDGENPDVAVAALVSRLREHRII